MGLARRAARKLVPVVLTLGSGPSGFPRKLSGRRPKLPRQPRRGRVARARSRNFKRWELARRASRNNFPGDGRSFRDSHGKPAPSHARGPLFWRWGLARRASRNNFPGDGQSFCDSLPRARFRRFGAGGWPDGLPETSFRATQSGGILDADSHGKPAPSHARAPFFRRWGLARRASRKKLPRQPWQTRAVARARSVILALGAGPSGFPKQVSERRNLGGRRGICGPKPMSQHGRPRLSRARTRPVAAMADLSTRSGQIARSLASGCGWPISYCPV